MPFFYEYPRFCAECYQLNVKKQMGESGESRFFYLCDKHKEYVDGRKKKDSCDDGMKRQRSDEDYTILAISGEKWK